MPTKTPKNGFEDIRKTSLEYLNEVDDRNWIGWYKVDPSLQGIVGYIHQNPNLCHYGESCSGHVYEDNGKKIEPGHIQIGIDGSNESRRIISSLERIVGTSDYAQMIKEYIPHYREGELVEHIEVYRIMLDTKFLTKSDKKSKTPEEHMKHYETLWKKIETSLKRNCTKYPPVWDKEATAQYKPDLK